MGRSEEQKILDIMMDCIMTTRHSSWFEGKTNEEVAEWVRLQLSQCGIETVPMGMSWAVIVDKPKTENTKWEIIEAGRPE